MARCCEEFTEDLTDSPLCMIHFIREPVMPIVLYLGRRVVRGAWQVKWWPIQVSSVNILEQYLPASTSFDSGSDTELRWSYYLVG